jgi:hypothetical protein
MARRRNLEPDEASGGLAPVNPDRGYTLGEGQRMEDVLAVEADLLRSEGIDPAWPGFKSDRRSRRAKKRGHKSA